MKAEKREVLGLPPLPEDSIKVIRNMRAASPPASASDLIEQQQKRGRREHKVRAELGTGHRRAQDVILEQPVPGVFICMEQNSPSCPALSRP